MVSGTQNENHSIEHQSAVQSDSVLGEKQKFFRIDWDASKYFYAVAKLGAFLRAGRYLNVSQSLLTRKVQALEEQLGVTLLQRQSRGVILTAEGSDFLPYIEKTLLGFRSFHYRASKKKGLALRIAIPAELSHRHGLRDAFASVLNMYEDLRLEVITAYPNLDPFIDDIDIMIQACMDEKQVGAEGLECIKLMSSPLHLYVHEHYEKKYGVPQTCADFVAHKFIAGFGLTPAMLLMRQSQAVMISRQPQKYDFVRLKADNFSYMLAAAQAGLGLLVAPSQWICEREHGLRRIVTDMSFGQCIYTLTSPRHLNQDPRVAGLISALQQNLAQQ